VRAIAIQNKTQQVYLDSVSGALARRPGMTGNVSVAFTG
jgi:hypothetical protein